MYGDGSTKTRTIVTPGNCDAGQARLDRYVSGSVQSFIGPRDILRSTVSSSVGIFSGNLGRGWIDGYGYTNYRAF